MKKRNALGIIIGILLVVLLIIIFYPKPVQENEPLDESGYNVSQEKKIGTISSWVETLEQCRGHTQYLTQQEKYDAGYDPDKGMEVKEIDDYNLTKLKSLENLGVVQTSIDDSDYFLECTLLWTFTHTDVVVRLSYHTLYLYDCGKEPYVAFKNTPGAPTLDVYMINPNEEVINDFR